MKLKNKILIYKKNLEFYAEAESTVKASLLTGVPPDRISRCATGVLLTSSGFVFIRIPTDINHSQEIDDLLKEYFAIRKSSPTQYVNENMK